MIDLIVEYNVVVIVSMFGIFLIAEWLIPLHQNRARLGIRWSSNIGLALINLLVARLAAPAVAVLTAVIVERLGYGIFATIDLNSAMTIVLGLVVIDFCQYWFHRMMHYFDLLWLVHRVHHSDVEIDLTTGFRFHPVEALITTVLEVLVIALFGIAPEVILLRYFLIYFVNFFVHGNIYLPAILDRSLQWILVTPSMHHLHHALDKQACNSNYGIVFSIWDRLFGSHLVRRDESTGEMIRKNNYGISEYRQSGKLNLGLVLWLPFVKSAKPPSDVQSERID